jgi:hypothetical protein
VSYLGTTNEKAEMISIPESITIGDREYKVTSIADNAFKNNKALKKVTISRNIETIGAGAFAGCSNLNRVTVKGSGLKEIGKNAFAKCISLEKFTIGKNVTDIGSKAFQGCKKLENITIKAGKLKKVGSKAFMSVHKKCRIIVPNKKFTKYRKMIVKSGITGKVKVVKGKF